MQIRIPKGRRSQLGWSVWRSLLRLLLMQDREGDLDWRVPGLRSRPALLPALPLPPEWRQAHLTKAAPLSFGPQPHVAPESWVAGFSL